ncbi:MAG: endonuclease domain-containing protein, partial [Fibrobacterota bacterium]
LVCHSGLDPESIIRWWIPAFAGMTEKASLPFDTPQLAAGRIHYIMPKLTELVRSLRKNQTSSEKLLWEYLRNRKLDGRKFIRQQPIRYSIEKGKPLAVADFYCKECRLIIELDGLVHMQTRRIEQDRERDQFLHQNGYRVIRFVNEAVEYDIVGVLNKIRECFIHTDTAID